MKKNTSVSEKQSIDKPKSAKKMLGIVAIILLVLVFLGVEFYLNFKNEIKNTADNINSSRSDYNDARSISDIEQIKTALELNLSDTGKYSDDLTSLLVKYQMTDMIDANGANYSYTKITDKGYTLCFTLENDHDNYNKGENCLNKNSQ